MCRSIIAVLFLASLLVQTALGQNQVKPYAQNKGPIEPDSWKRHEVSAEQFLHLAAECQRENVERLASVCVVEDDLKHAGEEYHAMQSLIPKDESVEEKISVIADGLSRSGSPSEAVEFLLRRSELSGSGTLLQQLADMLFSLGDEPNAAVAYERWIKGGCKGYSYRLRNETWIENNKVKDRCMVLPEPLWARLKMLQARQGGHPTNLPAKNFPPFLVPSTTSDKTLAHSARMID
jgi:hypothetical protein